MNIFKYLGQNLTTSGQSFPYNIGPIVTSYVGKSIWTLHTGTKKEDNSQVSIFSFDIKKNPAKVDVAKNGFKRSKITRHPNVIKYLDGLETETNIYIVTEPVQPLDELLNDIRSFENAISWGIYQVTEGLAFLNNKYNLTHGNIQTSSIFVNKGGDWKIGGLDFVSDLKDINNSILRNHNDLIPNKYKSPEVIKSQWSQIQQAPPFSIDAWMLGCLMYECYNGTMTKAEDIKNLDSIPKVLHPAYQKSFAVKLESRLNPLKFLESPYFQNVFVETLVFLENITLKDTFEKEQFFKKLDQHIEKIPSNICKFKILPHLVTAFDLGPVNPKLLGTLLKIGSNLSTEEYNSRIVPSVVKWFACDDRALRINLLENLEHYIQHLSESTINDQIFPHVVNGFNDNPTLKELTIKSMLLFAPKFQEKTMITLLKYFAALQKDQQPGVRCNTTICLGRITEYMSEQTRKRVLIPAFSTALKDPFVPSQNAGIQAFMFTLSNYSLDDLANRIIPEVSKCLISPEKVVRTSAFTAINMFLQKIEKNIDSILPPPSAVNNNPNNPNQPNQPNNNNATDDSMLGWAVGFTKKLIINSTENSPSTNSNSTSPPPQQFNNNNNNNNQKSPTYNNNSNNSNTYNNKPSQPQTTSSSSTTSSKPKVIHDGWGDDDEPTPTTNNNNNNKSKYKTYDDDDDEDDYQEEDYSKYKEDLPRLSSKSPSPTIANKTPSKDNKPMTLVSKKPVSKFSFDEDEEENNNNNNNNKNKINSSNKNDGWGDDDQNGGWDDNDIIPSKSTLNSSSNTSIKKTVEKKTTTIVKNNNTDDGWGDGWD